MSKNMDFDKDLLGNVRETDHMGHKNINGSIILKDLWKCEMD
jgi:hypothetical protein